MGHAPLYMPTATMIAIVHCASNNERKSPPGRFIVETLVKMAAISEARAAAIAVAVHLPIHARTHVTRSNIIHCHYLTGDRLLLAQYWHCIGRDIAGCQRTNAERGRNNELIEFHYHNFFSFT